MGSSYWRGASDRVPQNRATLDVSNLVAQLGGQDANKTSQRGANREEASHGRDGIPVSVPSSMLVDPLLRLFAGRGGA